MSSAPTTGGQSAPYSSHESKYVEMQQTPEFQDLRRRYRGFVLPVAAGALAWYFLYVLLAAYAPGFMGRPVLGNVNVGLLAGLLQFLTTFGITAVYIRFADRRLDPVSSRIRSDFEGGHR